MDSLFPLWPVAVMLFVTSLVLGLFRRWQISQCLKHGHRWRETPTGFYCPRCGNRRETGGWM